jgi:hypothetical protein
MSEILSMLAVIPRLLTVVAAELPAPPSERPALAALLAAADNSRLVCLWPALRVAVTERRRSHSASEIRH